MITVTRLPGPRASAEQDGHLLVEELLDGLEALPGQRAVLMRVVAMCADDESSLRDLADACSAEPPFAARILTMANSAFYARNSPANSLDVGITTIGRQTLRSLALTSALGMTGNSHLPPGFWGFAAQVATASAEAAALFGARSGDAFCGGLLADVGEALLLRAAPKAYIPFLSMSCGPGRLAAESEWCGIGHAELGAEAMSRVKLPAELCQAIREHHSAGVDGQECSPLARAVHTGSLLAHAAENEELSEEEQARLDVVSEGRLTAEAVERLLLNSAAATAALAAAVG